MNQCWWTYSGDWPVDHIRQCYLCQQQGVLACVRKPSVKNNHWTELQLGQSLARWWFQKKNMFTPIWERFPNWLIFFRWVETTNPNRYWSSLVPEQPLSSWLFVFSCNSLITCSTFSGLEPSSFALYPEDPWDWYIYLHLVDFYDKFRYYKYTIHGSYG